MDIIKYLNIFAIIFPLTYAIFLLIFKLSLIDIKKQILNYGAIIVNLFSLIVFSITFFFCFNANFEQNLTIPFLKTNDFLLELNFLINKTNSFYLLLTSFFALCFSGFLKFYFKKHKQFIFTKQRFLTLFSFSIFNLYLFILSKDIFTSLIFWIMQGFFVYLFTCFDLIKTNINNNISRFSKISSLGNFSLLCAVLILFKYTNLSSGFIDSNNLNYENLKSIAEYIYSTNQIIDFRILVIALFLPILTRFYLFPFTSYPSFLSSSSNPVFINVCFINIIFGCILFLNIFPVLNMANNFNLFVYILSTTTILLSLIFILFEKNIKIIFGYLIAAINSFFLGCYFYFVKELVFYIFIVATLLIFILLAFLFFKGKTQLSKRILTKHKGFLFEKIYIILFEKLPHIFSFIVNLINEKIIQNIIYLFVSISNFIISIIFLKTIKFNYYSIIKYILIIFALITVFAILTALFGGLE